MRVHRDETFLDHRLERRIGIRRRSVRVRPGKVGHVADRRIRLADKQTYLRFVSHRALLYGKDGGDGSLRRREGHFIFERLRVVVLFDEGGTLHAEDIVACGIRRHALHIAVRRGQFLLLGAVALRRKDDRHRNGERGGEGDAQPAHGPLHDLRIRLACLRPLPEAHGQDKFVHDRHDQVHDEDGEGYAFRIGAEPADEHGDHAQPDGIEHAVVPPLRGSRVIGRHKEGAEQQPAREKLQQHFGRAPPQGERHHRGREEIDERDAPVDDAADEQICPARENGDLAGLADAAADAAEQQLQNVRPISFRAPKGAGKGRRAARKIGRARRNVRRKEIAGGVCAYELRHGRAVCEEEEHARRRRGVGKVFAQPAEEHLDDDDGEHAADDGDIPRGAGRKVQPQDDARDQRGKVEGERFFPREVAQLFRGEADGRADDDEHEGIQPEKHGAAHDAGKQRDEHVEHDAPRVRIVRLMRGGGYFICGYFCHVRCPSPL